MELSVQLASRKQECSRVAGLQHNSAQIVGHWQRGPAQGRAWVYGTCQRAEGKRAEGKGRRLRDRAEGRGQRADLHDDAA